ncbi:ferrichrome-iron receptor precursor [Roseomonas sp. TAS13]|nr:ferrichrome-iron receptor precursor [Roseomonas sp. TAS13]
MSTAPKHPWALSRTGAAALTAASLALTPHAALSQDTTVQLPEIQVQGQRQTSTGPVQGYVATQSASATKTDTPLIETPQSVTVVTRDQMDDRAVRNVEEALAYVPGLATGFSGNDTRFDSFRLRGFDARPSQFLDGLRLLRQFGPTSIEQDGLERIEVIRGPNSVLYGQTPPGGMINMISKRPTERPFGEVNLQAGSYDRYQGSFDLGGPLTQDGQFLYRLTGLVRQSGTQVDHVNDDRYFIAPAITWRPGADTTLTLLGRFQYDQGGSPIGLPAVGTLLPNRNGTIKPTGSRASRASTTPTSPPPASAGTSSTASTMSGACGRTPATCTTAWPTRPCMSAASRRTSGA